MTSCAIVGVVIGRTIAISHNNNRTTAILHGEKPEPKLSVTESTVVAAVVGLAVDAFLVLAAYDAVHSIHAP